MDFIRRTWAEIDLDALDHNIAHIKKAVPEGHSIMGIVKADAYGHGDGFVARRLAERGISAFGVSNIEEAISLRREGITAPILILGYTPVECAALLSQQNITQAAVSLEYAEALQAEAQKAGVVLDIHIKLDTGMTRVGFVCDPSEFIHSLQGIKKVSQMENLRITGIFTHFAVADTYTGDCPEYTQMQFDRYVKMIKACKEEEIEVGLCHVANSAATISYPSKHLDMVRSGIITYGMLPSSECEGKIDIKPLMTLKTSVALVKTIKAGSQVSYGRTFTAEHDMVIATVPIGYADGYNRLLSNKGRMLVKGQYAPVVGRVCMDQTMIDITGIEGVQIGDEVVVMGKQGDNVVSAEEIAGIIGTINYEITCAYSKRVPRVYMEGGKVIGVVDHVMHQYK